ncbi:MAG: beta-ketoacyl-[acyl-carrier-protein] synthase family protein [Planctomycetes bacterium]|nr:beta-ketoacyl-[acyl-carrier-protein] synthase family protein [Planctomycetota bacterium]
MAEIVATGLGCISAAGGSVDAATAAMLAGERAPRPPLRFALDLGRDLPVFEIDSDLAAATAARMQSAGVACVAPPSDWFRTSRLAALAACEAIEQAGLDAGALRGARAGVAVGTTVGCTLNDEAFYRAWRQGSRPEPGPALRRLANNPALHLADLLGLDGPAATIANACSSGADAIGLGMAWLESGRCDVVLAGGSDELSRLTCLGFASLMIASERPCRPFDLKRDGLNLGEGAGMIVLETRAALERRRGPRPLARLLGFGTAADAHHATAPHPEGRGLARAIQKALAQAGCAAARIGFVNAHGTSTRDNDRVEGRVMKDVLAAGTPVVSTKAYTGHTLGAAGAIEAVFTIRALQDGRLPATAGFATPDPECAIVPTTRALEVEAEVALSNSLAFGGNNSVLLFGRA